MEAGGFEEEHLATIDIAMIPLVDARIKASYHRSIPSGMIHQPALPES